MRTSCLLSIVLFGATLLASCGEGSTSNSSEPASGGSGAAVSGGSLGEARGGSTPGGRAGSGGLGGSGGSLGVAGSGGRTEMVSGGQAPTASGGSAPGGGAPEGGGRDIAGAGGGADAPFEECVVENERVDGFGCGLSLACGADQVRIWCTDSPRDSAWECACDTRFGKLQYEVDTETASAACQVVADACQRSPRVEFDEPHVCPNPAVDRSIQGCEASTTCEQRELLAPGLVAYQMRVIGGACVSDSEEAESAACECEGLGPLTYELQGYNHREGCLSLLQLCGTHAVFPNEATCEVEMESAPSSGACLRAEMCTTSVVVEGVERTLSTVNDISCEASSDGRARCQCAGRLDFELFDDPVEASTCAAAGDVCSASTPVTLEREPAVCATNGESSNAELCSAKLDCSSAAHVAGVDLLLHGSIMIYCKTDGWPLEWLCDCYGSDTPTQLEFDAEDAAAACRHAIDRCPTLVIPEFGVPLDFGP